MLKCIDEDSELLIRGYNTDKVRQQLVIELERCSGPTCKAASVIDEWFEGKYLVLLSNNKRFNPLEIDYSKRIIEESVL